MNLLKLNVIIFLSLWVSIATAKDSKATILAGGSAESLYDTSVTDAKIVFTLIFNEAIEKSNEQFELEIFDTDEELSQNLLSGVLDAIFTNTLHFLEIEEHLNPNGCYVVQHGPDVKSLYYLLVRRDSGIDKLSQLQGKKISIPFGHDVGRLFLDVKLMGQGLPKADRFFSEIRQTRESNSSVVNLFFGKVDAALITDFSYNVAKELNSQIDKRLSVIEISEPLIYHIVSVRRDFPQYRIDRIEPYILNLQDSPRVAEILKTLKVTALHKVNDNTLTEVRKLNDEYHKLLKTVTAQ